MLFYVVSYIENGSSSCSVSWRGVLYWDAAKAYLCVMNVYEAIEKMRKLSAAGESFSFTFMSYNSSAGKSDGVVEVRHGMLRARQSTDYNKNAEYMESYIDLDTGEYRQFWQPLLMTFEGEKTILI